MKVGVGPEAAVAVRSPDVCLSTDSGGMADINNRRLGPLVPFGHLLCESHYSGRERSLRKPDPET